MAGSIRRLLTWRRLTIVLVAAACVVLAIVLRAGTSSAATTVTFDAAADTYSAQDAGTTNFGADTKLVNDNTAGRVHRSYLRFNVSGIPAGATVNSASLRMTATKASSATADVKVVTGAWTETGLTFANAPAYNTAVVASGSPSPIAAGPVTFDVSSVVKGNGTFDFVLTQAQATQTLWSSREGSAPPQLLVSYTPSATASPTPTPTPTPAATPAPSSVTLAPTDDAAVKHDTPATNYGATASVQVDGSPIVHSLLKFTVSGSAGRPVSSAKLRLYVTDPSPSGGAWHRVTDNSWSEKTVTWNTAPAAQAASVATLGAVATGTWVTADVTSMVTGDGTYSLLGDSASTDGALYSSKEAAANRPQLVVTYASPTSTPTPTAPGPSAGTPCGVKSTAPATYDHVLWILFENKTYGSVIGNANAPYISKLASRCASVANWADAGSQYPSLPSYLALTSGDTQRVSNDSAPANLPPITADNLFRQVRARGGKARSYEEDMPANCTLVNSGSYAVRHNPAAYYQGANDRTACASDDVPMGTTTSGAFSTDLANGTLPAFAFITPNACNDMHDCPVATGDAWLGQWLPKILDSSTYRAGRTAVFVVWDEDTPVPNVEVAPSVKPGTVLQGSYSHYSLLRTTEEMLGIPTYLLEAAGAPSLRSALGF
jgi:hypothetical protein